MDLILNTPLLLQDLIEIFDDYVVLLPQQVYTVVDIVLLLIQVDTNCLDHFLEVEGPPRTVLLHILVLFG